VSSVEFGTLFEFIRNGMNIKQDKSGEGLPITRIETIADANINGFRVGYAGLEENDCRDWLMESGDILFSHINSVEHIGKCAVYRGAPEKLVHGMNLLCLRCNPAKLFPEFAKYLIRSPAFRSRLSTFINKAVNQASVSIGNLKTIPVVVPALEEQRRIAGILDRAEELRSKRREAIAQLDALTPAIFLEMFGNPVINPKGWDWNTLGNICAEIYRYPTFYGFEYQETGTPVARIGNILLDGRLDPDISNYVFIDPAISRQFPRTILELQDIVMAVRGDGSTAKRIGLVTSDSLVSANISPNLLRFKAKAKVSHPLFLFHFMVSDLGQSLLESYVTRTAKKTITAEVIKKIKIPLPPFSFQQEFAHRVEAVEKLKAAHRASLSELDTLFASLQHRAFRGEL